MIGVLELHFLIIVACAIVILFASKALYHELLHVAEALRLPAFLVASMIVALSTSIPELFIGLTSAFGGEPSFALGNLIGANIIGLTLVAGLVLILGRRRVRLSEHIARSRLAFTFGIACVPIIMLFGGAITRVDGVVLLVLYGAYVFAMLSARPEPELAAGPRDSAALRASLPRFLLSVAVLVVASQVLYWSASAYTIALGVTPFVVGLFALSLSTMLPEISFGIQSAFRDTPELSLADIVGSSAVNACGILGLVAVISPITPVDLTRTIADGLFFIALVLMFYLLLWEKETNRIRGGALLGLYGLFILLNIFT